MKIDLDELVKENLLSKEQASSISEYYRNQQQQGGNRMLVAFAILGAILVGLGVILIIAHNWDDLSRQTRTVIAFVPLILSQLLVGFVLIKKRDNKTSKEASGVLLCFSIGASISLVSQIYHIPGNIAEFLVTWSLLSLPIVYLLNSSSVGLLYLTGITAYGCNVAYFSSGGPENHRFWMLLLGLVPFYVALIQRGKGNFRRIYDWAIPVAIIIMTGAFANQVEEVMFAVYVSLFGMFYVIGRVFSSVDFSYSALGSLGMVIVLLILSFGDVWTDIVVPGRSLWGWLFTRETGILAGLTLINLMIVLRGKALNRLNLFDPFYWIVIAFPIVFFVGLYMPIGIVLTNLLVLFLGVFMIRKGSAEDHLGKLNYGLGIIASLIICRFFDQDLSFVVRGLLFILVGVAFFITNYIVVKRKRNEA